MITLNKTKSEKESNINAKSCKIQVKPHKKNIKST